MSSESLSQREVDLLLEAQRSPQESGSRLQGDQEARSYDFRRPHRVSKERLRTLEAMYERLVKSIEGWLVGRVRGKVELALRGVEQQSFGEFSHTLPTPCASYLFDIANTGGQQGVVDFGREFAFFLVDRLFGGGNAPTVPDRGLTPIERMAVRNVAERVVAVLSEVWQDHVVMELGVSGFESIPEILRAESRDDPVLVAHVGVTAANIESRVSICLPFPVLEKFFSSAGQRRVKTQSGSESEQEANREVAEASLRMTRVAVAARLPEFRLSMRELTRLREGGVLMTGIPVDSELVLHVNSQPRFRATAGRTGRRLAVRVIGPLDNDQGTTLDHLTQGKTV